VAYLCGVRTVRRHTRVANAIYKKASVVQWATRSKFIAHYEVVRREVERLLQG
jgi:hypothetical protein